MFTDPIADFLTRIRNANSAGHRVVDIPASNIKKEITKSADKQGVDVSEFKKSIDQVKEDVDQITGPIKRQL